MKNRLALLVSLFAGFLAVGCKSKPAEEFHYAFRLPGKYVPLHATLVLGGRDVGRLLPSGDHGGTYEQMYASAHGILPRATWVSDHAKDLKVRIDSPCGKREVPLMLEDGAKVLPQSPGTWMWSKAYETERRTWIDALKKGKESFEIEVPIFWAGAEPRPEESGPLVTFYVDDRVEPGSGGRHPQVNLGALSLRSGDDRFVTDALGCAPSIDVTVDGRSIGKLEPKPGVKAYILATEPTCYQERLLSYRTLKDTAPTPSSAPRHLPAATIHPVTFSEIDYFLKKAPSSTRGSGSLVEVLREECTSANVADSPRPAASAVRFSPPPKPRPKR